MRRVASWPWPSASRKEAQRLVVTLAITFAVTIASFLMSTAIAERQARGIVSNADRITATAVPGTELLSAARGEIRQMDEALDDIVYRGAALSALDDDRTNFAVHWQRYESLPDVPGAAEILTQAEPLREGMDHSIATVLERVAAGDRPAAERELTTHTRPALRAVSDALRSAASVNLRAVADAALEIEQLRRSSTSLRLALNAATTLSAGAAAFVVVRMARRFAALTDERLVEMERFAGRVAHDLRSPLNAVSLALELARRSPNLDAPSRTALERGLRTLDRVGQLIEGLLGFARAGTPGGGTLGARLDEVLGGVLDDMRRSAEAERIVLTATTPIPSGRVACSEGVLVSLVSNLLGNAIKYMGDSPQRHVTVGVKERSRSYRIEVHDTGPGIPRDQHERIFELYTRAAQGVPGLGLGLATVRRLAEAHGGSCGVESEAGAGSSFWVELPKAHVRSWRKLAYA